MRANHRTGTRPARRAAVAVAMTLLAACSGGAGADDPSAAAAATTRPMVASSDTGPSPIVGRWMQVHTCEQLVGALEDAGLGEIAPAMVGDFFPGQTPEELAAKDDLCEGARPQRHYHFFTRDGAFGSIDQHGQQVDDGPYVTEGDTLHIGDDGTWAYEISGSRLSLTPKPTDEQIAQALAHPLEFSAAGWMVAVAYPGTTWKRVACNGWC